MAATIQGSYDGKGLRFGIVVARFNDFIAGKLLDGALDALTRHEVASDDITVVRVPGAFEIPLIAQQLAQSGKVDAVITLGAVIRGDTPHFEYVCDQATRGVGRVALDTNVPVIFGVLTVNDTEQAVVRADPKSENLGNDYALAALEMIDLKGKI